ncbi:hypothetical protein V0288_15325 [Pannus brasiliensis CCIBt3594]|uniref:Uncharacterized protein n=1 Tax=Pannus brasiliensis CCIBt3594 TaxID=1427578 RepID=A0AAW9QY85_9CHRO
MTAVTESDLKRLEDLIVNGQKAIENRLTNLETGQKAIENRLTNLETGQKAIETRLTNLETGQKTLELGQSDIKGDMKALDAKISGLNERIKPIDKIPDLAEKVGEFKIWRQVVIIAFTALVSGVVTWIVRNSLLNP